MKQNIKNMIVAAVILAALMSTQTVSAAPFDPAVASGPVSQLMYDNFDDNAIDTAHWAVEIRDSGPSLAEANQRLEMTVPANSSGDDFAAWFDSLCQLRGDYDIQVDYALLTWPNANGVRVGLSDSNAVMHRVSSGIQPNDYPGGPDLYMTIFDTADHVVGITPTSDLSGKLRLQRVGSTINSYYFNSDAWVLNASNSGSTYAEDNHFALGAWSADSVFTDQDVKVAFDNLIINSGNLVCPADIPSVTIEQAADQADPTGSSPILFTATFSQPVTGFGDAAADITLSGTASATTATVTETAPNDGTTYTVAVSGMFDTGTVIASIPAGAAVNAANNGNTASTSSDNTVNYNPKTGQVATASSTCSHFAAGTATDQNQVIFKVAPLRKEKGRIIAVEPIAFFYYSKVVAPSNSFRITVYQGNPYGWPLYSPFSYVYDANCNRIISHKATGALSIAFTVTNATPGAVYYVQARYQADTIVGKTVTFPYTPTIPYSFTTMVEGRLLRSSYVPLNFRPQ